MKVVVYARYSSDNQREESVEGQIRDCKSYCERNGMTIIKTYIDRALSAKSDRRPDFQNLIRDSEKRLFDAVVVWKLDRFSRNRYDSAYYKRILRKNGVRVISAMEPITNDATGILLESMLEGYAEFFSADLSEKIRRGQTENALKCKYNGTGLTVGYYIDNEQYFQIDEITAPVIREAFQRYADGGTVVEVAKWLNGKNVKNTKGRPLTNNVVTTILKNRTYIGEYRYGEHIIPNGVPAIIDEALFNRVQERFAKNKKMPTHFKAEDEYILTTKLFCGKCSKMLIGESGRSQTGTVHRYYKCITAKRKRSCSLRPIKKQWIEDFVVAEAMKMLSDNKALERVADLVLALQSKGNAAIPLLRQQLTETEKQIDNMVAAIAQGIITPSTKRKLNDLENEKGDLEIKLLQEEMSQKILTREQILFWLHKFRDMDTAQRDVRVRLIDCFVNAVYVYDDGKAVVTLNYRDGAETVKLSEIEDVFGSTMYMLAPLKSPKNNTYYHYFRGGFGVTFWAEVE
jgi:DNA invertase Pin-like site-specific DNA recombinase